MSASFSMPLGLFEKWRRASRPAVKGGMLPPGKIARKSAAPRFYRTFLDGTLFPPGWKPGATSAKMADATVFKQARSGFGFRRMAGCRFAAISFYFHSGIAAVS